MLLLLCAILGVTVPTIGVFRTLTRRRGAQRNESGCCAVCGQPWAARYPDVDQYVISGHMICADCGTRLRRRLRGGVFAVGAVVCGVAVATLLSNGFDIFAGNQSFPGASPVLDGARSHAWRSRGGRCAKPQGGQSRRTRVNVRDPSPARGVRSAWRLTNAEAAKGAIDDARCARILICSLAA